MPEAGITIGAAADGLGLSVETLRYYEHEGITLRLPVRGSDGRRRYGGRDLAWLAGVVMLRGTGMTMQELREFAAAYRDGRGDRDRLALLERHRERVVAQLAELAETHRHLEALERKIAVYQ